METEIEGVLACYVDLRGWTALFEACRRLAEQRREGRIGGIMQAAVGFLAEKGSR